MTIRYVKRIIQELLLIARFAVGRTNPSWFASAQVLSRLGLRSRCFVK